MKIILAVLMTPILAVGLLLGAVMSAGSSRTACSPANGTVVAAPIPPTGPVGHWSQAQAQVAATGLTAAHQAGVNVHAATILIMTGMGESSLQDLDHGDAVDNSTIGWLQQGASYGPPAARMDVSRAATAFLTRLLGVTGWANMEPTLAAHAVQRNADPYHYRAFWDDATTLVAALTGTGGTTQGCQVGGDPVTLARTLIDAQHKGTFTDRVEPGLIDAEIKPIADGHSTRTCQIDPRVLQMLVLALTKFGKVGISDLNRPCMGETLNCAFSAHCFTPSTAIDFSSLGDSILTGSNQASLNLISYLDPVVPAGSQVGQAECRASAGNTLTLTHLHQFDDACNHVHIDLQHTVTALILPTN